MSIPPLPAAFRDLVNDQFTDWTISPAAGENNGYLLTMKPSVVADLRTETMDQALETITRRINALGLTEPTIAFTGRGDNEILVQLPGEGDPTRAKSVIQAGGQLQLKLLADEQTYPSQAAALAAHGGVLPPGTEIVPGKIGKRTRRARLRSRSITFSIARPSSPARICAAPARSPAPAIPGQYEVDFTLSTAAAARFGPFTEANVGHRMAIVLDNQVYTAPVINSRIEDRGEITGNFSQESAQDLALVLQGRRACPLPSSISKSAPSVLRSAPIRSARACALRSAASSW